jgi:hypothetical protein
LSNFVINPYIVSSSLSPHCFEDSNTSKGFNSTRSRAAMKVTSSHVLAGTDISQVTFYTDKESGGTGTCYARIYNNDKSLVGTIGSVDISTLDVTGGGTPNNPVVFSGTTVSMSSEGGYLSLDGVDGQQIYAMDDSGTEANAVLTFYDPTSTNWTDQTGEGLRYCATFTAGFNNWRADMGNANISTTTQTNDTATLNVGSTSWKRNAKSSDVITSVTFQMTFTGSGSSLIGDTLIGLTDSTTSISGVDGFTATSNKVYIYFASGEAYYDRVASGDSSTISTGDTYKITYDSSDGSVEVFHNDVSYSTGTISTGQSLFPYCSAYDSTTAKYILV